jgi:hypothetical protein
MIYRAYSHRIETRRPISYGVPVDEIAARPPEITLSFLENSLAPHPWEDLPWTAVRKLQGVDWGLNLSIAPVECPAWMRLETRAGEDVTTVLFGARAAQIVIDCHSPFLQTEQYWKDLSGWIFGSVMGYAMHLRGLPTLHASVVAADGQAIAFLGESGAGKSTLAAAFVRAGHGLLADDHLVARVDDGDIRALPGVPHLRLLPASLEVIGGEPAPAAASNGVDAKHFVDLSKRAYRTQPAELAAIYLLAPRQAGLESAAIQPLLPAAALYSLLGQRFSRVFISTEHASGIMSGLSGLAQRVPVRVLACPQDLGRLPGVVRAVLEDVRAHG